MLHRTADGQNLVYLVRYPSGFEHLRHTVGARTAIRPGSSQDQPEDPCLIGHLKMAGARLGLAAPLQRAPDLLRRLDNEGELVPLLLLGKIVALLGGGEAALG